MEEQDVRTARDSLGRCVKSLKFLDRFYELLMDSSDEIREKFAETDFGRQKKVLQDSLFLIMVAAGTSKGMAHRELEKLGERHSREQMNIKPEWYTPWVDCLMKAVEECDPEYSETLDGAWRRSLEPGIELLKSKY